MALVSVKQALKDAQAGGYALALFDTYDMHTTDGMFQAFEEKRAHAFIGLYGGFFEQPNAAANVAYIREAAASAKVPVSLMLSVHGASFEQCDPRHLAGFHRRDVRRFEKLPLEENIAKTKLVVRAARAVAALRLRPELGHVGSGNEYQKLRRQAHGLHRPGDGRAFRRRDRRGLSGGRYRHGARRLPGRSAPRSRPVSRDPPALEIPLVMHGGSGLSGSRSSGPPSSAASPRSTWRPSFS